LQHRGIDIGRYGYNIPQSQPELMRSIGIWQAQDQSNERFAVQYQNMTARQALREDMASIETRRIQIGKELNQVMLEETQLRYSMIQHAAQEALDAPNELRSLNVAIARLKDYVGTAALPFGSPDNLAAHEQYMRVVEGFSSLEDQTLSGIRGAARRAGQSLQDYIESFISNTTGFQLPSDGLAAIMQQFGASEATEASEDLSLRMAANELQRRSNELTEENNRLLEQLRLVVYNLSQVSNRPLEGLSPPALEEALSFR
ncbi:MAG: hypothetical protein OXG15_02390, partial [Gammaproteobacteria bacterium]|nr:hypothetical protein [Gammaproteobacteria bacterium]